MAGAWKCCLKQAGITILGLMALTLTSCGGGMSPLGTSRQTDLGLLFPPVIATVTHLNDWTVSLVSTQLLDEVTLYFDNGDAETYDLHGLVQAVHSSNAGDIAYLKASTKGGDYWYFDNTGLWLPHGYDPKFGSSLGGGKTASSVWIGGTEIGITCSDTYTQVKVYFEDDSTQVFDVTESSGTYDLTIPANNVAAIRITLEADGSRYYFKPDGTELPLGTKWYEDAD